MSYNISIDIGGTFTDLILLDKKTMEIQATKVSTTPQNLEKGVLHAIKKIGADPKSIDVISHATTTATNTIIQRSGAKVGLITTEGFRDILWIQRGDREKLYDLQWVKPRPLIPRHLTFGVPERIDYTGRILKQIDEKKSAAAVQHLKKFDVEAIAVCFLFSYINPIHEEKMKEIEISSGH